MSLIRIENLCFSYEKEPVLRDLNLEIEAGSFWGIAGPNGAGKSTLLRLLAGLLKPTRGKILLDQKSLSRYSVQDLAGTVAMVPQEFHCSFDFTVEQMVMMARFTRQKRFLFERPEDREAVRGVLKETDILHLDTRPMSQLSGGERQRVYIARALAQETPILLLDEPASHLDMKHQVRMYDLLKKVQKILNKTILLVTHDLNLAGLYCRSMLMLGQQGKIFHGKTREVLEEKIIQEIFDIESHVYFDTKVRFFLPKGKWYENHPE